MSVKKLNCIMLIDDDLPTNVYHRIVLEEADCTNTIVIKDSGQDSLTYLRLAGTDQNPMPDIIFLDINMPRMSGWEFLQKCEQFFSHVLVPPTIIMLSTSSYPADIQRAKQIPLVSGYRIKPLVQQMLTELVDAHHD